MTSPIRSVLPQGSGPLKAGSDPEQRNAQNNTLSLINYSLAKSLPIVYATSTEKSILNEMYKLSLNTLTVHLLSILLSCLPASISAADLEKETRMKNQIIDYIMDGDAILLKDGKHEFLSIFMESESQPAKGTVIIMHGRGYHPNWPELVYPLRTGLPEHGWNTLSIQMPVLDNDATFYDYLEILHEAHPRIDAALTFLKQKKLNNIILLAHSCSVHMAIDWLVKHKDNRVTGFIGVGMGSTDKGQPMHAPFPLEKIKVPVLDIRGEDDYPAVIRHAPRRLQNIQSAGNSKSQQRVVAKSDHYFTERGDALLVEVADWLKSL